MFAIGSMAIGTTRAWAGDSDGVLHNAEAIHQEPVFAASPGRIYQALTDAKQFQKVQLLSGAMKASELTERPAQISTEPGGSLHLVRRTYHWTAD
jgi:hypothetical protein